MGVKGDSGTVDLNRGKLVSFFSCLISVVFLSCMCVCVSVLVGKRTGFHGSSDVKGGF